MLYDKIIESLIDVKRAIKLKLGDDGENKRGRRDFISGPFGYDRIQYEIGRIAEAIKHTTGGGGGSADVKHDETLIGDGTENEKLGVELDVVAASMATKIKINWR